MLFFSLIFTMLYGAHYSKAPVSLVRTFVKTASIALLATYAAASGGPAYLVAALAFCAIGDFFLSRNGDKLFLAGMAAFLAGHLFYVPLFWSTGGGMVVLSSHWQAPIVLIFSALALLILLWPHLGKFRWPVAAYVMAILAMGISVMTLPFERGSPLLIVCGAMSFVVSDMILSLNKFVLDDAAPLRRFTPYGVWVLYWGGQLAIVIGYLG